MQKGSNFNRNIYFSLKEHNLFKKNIRIYCQNFNLNQKVEILHKNKPVLIKNIQFIAKTLNFQTKLLNFLSHTELLIIIPLVFA